MEQFKCPNLTVEHGDFRETIQAHPTHFLFCDPPYVLKKDFIYGIRGNLHRDFPHGVLADLLKARDGWMLCYNDCDEVRDLYRGYRIEYPKWTYCMYRDKRSNEVLILPD